MPNRRFACLVLIVFAAAVAACSSGGSGAPNNGGGGQAGGAAGTPPGIAGAAGGTAGAGGRMGGAAGAPPADGQATSVTVTDPPAHASAVAALETDLASDRPATATAFQSRWPTKYLGTLPYDPLSAQGLDLLVASRLGVSAGEQQALARNGFVISERQVFPTFFYGYKAIYADHLPLFVSVDSVMHAVHRSYDSALMSIELSSLMPTLQNLLTGMHADLGTGAGDGLPADVRADVDLYLTVARVLLGDTTAMPVAGASAGDAGRLVSAAQAASGIQLVSLFGEDRYVDFTQFTPRGHYANDPRLQAYFRAMMWLGRTDFRFLQFSSSDPSVPPQFHRRQFLAALLLGELTDGNNRLGTWQQIDTVLHGFAGESDNMTVADFAQLRAAAGVTTWDDLAALSDEAIAQALLDGNFGIQRIASQILLVPPQGANLPLDRVFLFFGQRFVIDSQVFSDVVFDRVRGDPKRMMPDPLDAAFAALGNNAAVPLLASQLAAYPNYPGALHDARRLVDLHGDDFWGDSLYGAWLGALRGMSLPNGDPTAATGLPAVMQTEPWSRRVLNTQLASWAELRHDTLLYAKQSYTAVPLCDFPSAYVDPYPEAWAGIVKLAQLGQALGDTVPASYGTTLSSYFKAVASIAATLQAMAEEERAGQPLTADQLAFINQTVDEVTSTADCTAVPYPTGWYVGLFLTPKDAQTTDPTIADVHTDPADSAILHVATGLPRLMYVTVDGCDGPRAYAGVVSSYYQETTGNLQRLTDTDWSKQVMASPPPADVTWMSDLVAQ